MSNRQNELCMDGRFNLNHSLFPGSGRSDPGKENMKIP
jgi:hypothetical protein